MLLVQCWDLVIYRSSQYGPCPQQPPVIRGGRGSKTDTAWWDQQTPETGLSPQLSVDMLVIPPRWDSESKDCESLLSFPHIPC